VELAPYLNFNGNCAEAFRFYAEVLGGRVESMMTHADMPATQQAPPGWRDKILHARLSARGQVLIGSDVPAQYYHQPVGMAVSLTVSSPVEAHRIFAAFAIGGTVGMPFGPTFWSPGFGMVTDRFGISWMIMSAPVA
jgi:PhnB protein